MNTVYSETSNSGLSEKWTTPVQWTKPMPPIAFPIEIVHVHLYCDEGKTTSTKPVNLIHRRVYENIHPSCIEFEGGGTKAVVRLTLQFVSHAVCVCVRVYGTLGLPILGLVVQMPRLSLAVVTLSKLLYPHCSSIPSCKIGTWLRLGRAKISIPLTVSKT